MCSCFLICFDHELKANRATNLSPWTCIVAMLLEKQTQFDYSSLGIFEHLFQWNKKRRVEAIIHQKE